MTKRFRLGMHPSVCHARGERRRFVPVSGRNSVYNSAQQRPLCGAESHSREVTRFADGVARRGNARARARARSIRFSIGRFEGDLWRGERREERFRRFDPFAAIRLYMVSSRILVE